MSDKPTIRPADGNAFSILGAARTALRDARCPEPEIREFISRATSGDYTHLLRVVSERFEIRDAEVEARRNVRQRLVDDLRAVLAGVVGKATLADLADVLIDRWLACDPDLDSMSYWEALLDREKEAVIREALPSGASLVENTK
jgi:hypothetical protein